MFDLQIPSVIEDYYSFKKELLLWNQLTDISVSKRAGYIVMNLPGIVKKVMLDNIRHDELLNGRVVSIAEGEVVMSGFDILIEELDRFFLLSVEEEAYLALECFESFRRTPDVHMMDYILEFEQLYNHVKRFDVSIPDYVLAYKLINNADISSSQLGAIRAAVPALWYSDVKDFMKRIMVTQSDKELDPVLPLPSLSDKEDTRERSKKRENKSSDEDSSDEAVIIKALFKPKKKSNPSPKIKGKTKRCCRFPELDAMMIISMFHVCLTVFHICHSVIGLQGIMGKNCTMPSIP